MSDHRLNADERAILDRALEQEGPSSDRIDRIHRGVMKAVAAGAVGAAATAATTQAAAAATATKAGAFGMSATTKFWLTNLLIVSGLAGTGAVAGIATRSTGEESVSSAPAAVAPPVDELASRAAGTAEAPPATTEDDPRENIPEDVAPSTPSTRPASSASLDREVELLARAQQRLRDGDADGALRLLSEHDELFPRGALGPEAEAARVLALCKSGRRDEARRAATAFVARKPDSPLAERMRNACP